MPEIEQLPKTDQERPIPPDFIPEEKKHDDFEKPQIEKQIEEQ